MQPAESVTESEPEVEPDPPAPGSELLPLAATALVAGAALVATARTGALALLVALAVVQAVFGVAWVNGSGMPGRRGALVLAALAAGAADATVSIWPHGRLGTLLAVVGLAVPVMFVHQLMRGAARVQLVSSLSAVTALVIGEVSLAAWLQLRHEFDGAGLLGSDLGGDVAAAGIGAAFAGVLVAALVDVVLPAPRFDATVRRGVPALVAAIAVGAAIGHLVLQDTRGFEQGRGVFLGAALGGLAGLVSVAVAFVQHTTPSGAGALARWGRPLYGALLPGALLGPAAFLLALAVRG